MRAEKSGSHIARIAAIGGALLIAILVLTTMWMGRSAGRSTEEAVHAISNFYLQELAGRREQVVATNLDRNIQNIRDALSLMDDSDLSDMEHLQAFQARMKKLYTLEKFAFVDQNGLIYTSLGTQTDIENYSFNYRSLSAPDVSIKDLHSNEKKVVIAVPVNRIPFNGETLTACFMEIDMKVLLNGLSLQSDANGTTFCNLYYKDGLSLTNVVLGGLSGEHNLLVALQDAAFDGASTYEQINRDFAAQKEGAITFTYNGIDETMYYVPVAGTDWMLTYLIRESMISNRISGITQNIITRSLVQSLLIACIMAAVFAVIILQNRRTGRLMLEKETAEAENRVKQQELEGRLKLQAKLLEQERQQRQQNEMITAMASDYRSVYYIDLDSGQGVCYRADAGMEGGLREGESFPFLETFTKYANAYVVEQDREEFLRFIDPENMRARLQNDGKILAHRYLVRKNGMEQYEMLRMAGVGHPQDAEGNEIHAAGVGFSDVDQETRESMAQRRALSEALTQAEEANAAKTAFLSSMSHEIRTPMNAIIGLGSIALKDPGLPDRTRDHLEKIGGSAKHLLMLINDILDMSRIESGRMIIKNEEFSFQKMLEQINTMINGQCQAKGLSYDCQVMGHVDDYYIGDDMKLKQVLINILGNAVKFTPEGGAVTFLVEPVTQFQDKATMRFVVKDTGVGMDKDFIPKIFDAFSQEDENKANKFGSTGLGMAITKNIVELMNGDIAVESEKGVGSVFTVTVTLRTSDKKAQATEDIRPQDLRVLIIDDDPVACEHAKLVLEEVGIVSDICSSGKEALEMLRLAHARRTAYNLILVDLKMPEQDGVEVTRQIRELYNGESTIIILTAYSWDDIMEDAIEAGVDSFMSKPLFASGVLEEFRKAIQRKNVAPPSVHKTDLAGRHILLAEDMIVNAEIMKEILGMRDMLVDHAENGKIALDMFAEHPENYYSAVLMDVRMPVMNGLEAASAIRALDRPDAKQVPIIALTANAFDEDVQCSLQSGMNAHLSKPVEPDHLLETLEILIPEERGAIG